MSSVRQMVILAGGKGTRLGSLTSATPKPLMRISENTVFLDYIIDNVARQGFTDILIVAGHLGDQISNRYHNVRVRQSDISVFIEPEARGTGGALTFIEDHLAGAFLAMNGDTYFDLNFRALSAALQANPQLEAVMALRQVEDVGRYGSVDIDSDGVVTRFVEKNKALRGQRGLINGGVYALRHKTLGRMRNLPASIETELFPGLLRDRLLGSVPCSGYFIDIGLPDTLELAQQTLPTRKRPALFLDRDGVLNHDVNYLFRRDDWRWIDGALETIKMANDCGVSVIVVTNQAGIAYGKYGEQDLAALHTDLQQELHAMGAFIDEYYFCPYHPNAAHETYRVATPFDRKPAPNMLLRAARQHELDLSRSLFIGDQESDREAAARAGVPFELYRSGSLLDLVQNSQAWREACESPYMGSFVSRGECAAR